MTTLFGYTGRPFDAETGLQNNHHRWYDANTGRWISKDPIGFAAGDANLSRYVGNGTTNAVDPSGLGYIPMPGTEDQPPIVIGTPPPRTGPQEGPRLPIPWPVPTDPRDFPGGGGDDFPWPQKTPPIYVRIGPHTEILVNTDDYPDLPRIIVTPEEPSSFDLALDGLLCVTGVGLARLAKVGEGVKIGSRSKLHIQLREGGFQYHGTTRGGYVRYRHPSGKEVWIRPNGQVIRTGSKVNPPKGGKPYNPRIDADGNPINTHDPCEFVQPLPGQ